MSLGGIRSCVFGVYLCAGVVVVSRYGVRIRHKAGWDLVRRVLAIVFALACLSMVAARANAILSAQDAKCLFVLHGGSTSIVPCAKSGVR